MTVPTARLGPGPPAPGIRGRPTRWATLSGMPPVVPAPDKWRGSASATEVAATIAQAAAALGWSTDAAPVSDGGEGFAAVLGGRPHVQRARGPLGSLVDAVWYLLDDGVR